MSRRPAKLASKNKGVISLSKKKRRCKLNPRQFQPNRLSDELSRLGPDALSVESARSTSKLEGKDSQLPVAHSAPEVSLAAIVPVHLSVTITGQWKMTTGPLN